MADKWSLLASASSFLRGMVGKKPSQDVAAAPVVVTKKRAGDIVGSLLREASVEALSRQPDKIDMARAAELARDKALDPEQQEIRLEKALECVRTFPGSERIQVFAARVIEDGKDHDLAWLVWQGILARFPGNHEAFRMDLRWTIRQRGVEAGVEALRKRFPSRPDNMPELLLYARGLDETKNHEAADAVFEEIITRDPEMEEAALAYAQSLRQRLRPVEALNVLDRADACLPQTSSRTRLRVKLEHEASSIRQIVTDPEAFGSDLGNQVLAALVDRLGESRRNRSARMQDFLGPVMMVNGSLGPGGAERQFVNTAKGLQKAITDGDRIADVDVVGPVQVCVKSLTTRAGGDFFQQELREKGIDIWEYAKFEPYGGSAAASLVREHQKTMRHLPRQMAEGLEKITDVTRVLSPDVVHIWQDGSIFSTALGALLAEVPRIILSVRTLPPIDRPDRYKPQYETLYRSLLKQPGVVLSANSRFAAERYAAWLDIDPAMIPVVYNGLEPLPVRPDDATRTKFEAFDAQTADATFTVGVVARFDENKRPYLWLDMAAALLQRTPGARFIMIGDGPLLPLAQEYAARLGIGRRVLFVGRSSHIGFWLSKLDAFVLLSKFEGLPNVLIEAQFAGVPVYTTPAGGAAETVKTGHSGHVFRESDASDPRVMAAWLEALSASPASLKGMGEEARRWATSSFTVERMIEQTVELYAR
jgi:glycosyltransferase involved in cell wall biosynthesis